VCVSTSLLRLLSAGAPTTLDEPAVALYLRKGLMVGDDTPFAAIRRLPPAGRFEWRPDGAWSVSGGPGSLPPVTLSRAEALDAFIERFRSAVVNRATGADSIVPLSGGRDSRHLVLALCAAGCRPRLCVTVRNQPPALNEDARVATILAEALGLEHVVLDQSPSAVDVELRMNQRSGWAADWHSWFLRFGDFLAANPAAEVHVGYGGDTVARGRAPQPAATERWLARDAPGLATLQLTSRPHVELAMQQVLTSEGYRRFSLDLAHARLADELARHMSQPNPELSFTAYNGLRRRTAPQWFPMCSDHALIRVPFLDRSVYDLMASLPAETPLGNDFHTDAIARAFPRYRNVPYTDYAGARKTLNVDDHRNYFRRYAEELTAYAFVRSEASFVDVRRVAERLSGCRKTGDGTLMQWLQPGRILWLLQLEALARDTASTMAA
jgi:hypothetical protein